MAHLRAVIQGNDLFLLLISSFKLADDVMVFDCSQEDHAFQSSLIHDLQGRINSKDLPFELKYVYFLMIFTF